MMAEEIFGPILTVYVYDDAKLDETLDLCDRTSPYALTGAVFAQDRKAIVKVFNRLRHAAGNFYINDKPTGAVVGLQPFGGARASGTNDKAGSILNLIRWTSPRTIKETYVPPTHFGYPFMAGGIEGFRPRSLCEEPDSVRRRGNLAAVKWTGFKRIASSLRSSQGQIKKKGPTVASAFADLSAG